MASHITDVNLAVKLYLKYHENKDENSFVEELKAYTGMKEQNNQKVLEPVSDADFPEGVELNDKTSPHSISPQKSPASSIDFFSSLPSPASKVFSEVDNPSLNPVPPPSVRSFEAKNNDRQSFFSSLDEKSRAVLEKAQAQLNIPLEETLKVLIQLGSHSLKNLFK